MAKIKEFGNKIKDYFVEKKESLKDMYVQMFWKHPFILGMIEGQILIYWVIVLGAFFSSLIHKKRRIWKLTDYK